MTKEIVVLAAVSQESLELDGADVECPHTDELKADILKLNGIDVHRVKNAIFIPLPESLWRSSGSEACSCGKCDGRGMWDTLSVAAKAMDRYRDYTYTCHYPELHAAVYARRKAKVNGYDYKNQAWVVDGKYVSCVHRSECNCFGRLHAGEPVAVNAEVR